MVDRCYAHPNIVKLLQQARSWQQTTCPTAIISYCNPKQPRIVTRLVLVVSWEIPLWCSRWLSTNLKRCFGATSMGFHQIWSLGWPKHTECGMIFLFFFLQNSAPLLILKLLTHVKPGQITNPNNAWDMSKNVAPINKRVFQYQNFLHYITILLHLLVLLPLSSTLLMTNGSRKRWIQFILDRFKKRPL